MHLACIVINQPCQQPQSRQHSADPNQLYSRNSSQIQELGEADGTGYYWLRLSDGSVESVLCNFDGGLANTIDFGSGADGNVVISGARTVLIESLFTNYRPRAVPGRYPNWINVTLSGGAVLSTSAYDASTGLGGKNRLRSFVPMSELAH